MDNNPKSNIGTTVRSHVVAMQSVLLNADTLILSSGLNLVHQACGSQVADSRQKTSKIAKLISDGTVETEVFNN